MVGVKALASGRCPSLFRMLACYVQSIHAAVFPFYDGFESGPLGDDWTISTSNQGRVQVSSSYLYADTYSFQFYDDDPIPTDGYAFDEVQVWANAAPTLVWPGNTNYEQDGLHPESSYDTDKIPTNMWSG